MAPSSSDDLLDASVDPAELPAPTESMRLVGEAQAGNRQALEDLLSRYQDRLRRIVSIRLSSRLRRCVESMDIVQETFVSAFGHIDKLEVRGTASILQWLSRIAENQMHDTYRRHYGLKRDKSREIGLATGVPGDEERELAVPALTDEMTPDHRAEKREMEQIVDEAVAELPEDYREVIILRTYYGGSWDFVTTQMGRPNVDATRQLFRRARIRLGRLVRQRLASGGDPEPAPD